MLAKLKKARPSAHGAEPNAPRKKKQAIAAALTLLALAAFGFYLHSRGRVSTDDAFMDGRTYAVTPRVSGYVESVRVDDNQKVSEGEVLVVLDPTDYQVALAKTKADLAAAESKLAALLLDVPLTLDQTSSKVAGAKAQLASLYKNLDQLKNEEEAARQETAQAQALLEQAKLDLTRYASLRSREVLAQADMDGAQTRERTAEAEKRQAVAKAEAAKRKRDALLADVERLNAEIRLAASGKDQAGIKAKEAEAQQALVNLAREQVRQAELNLQYATIKSPVDGFVTKRAVEEGRLVAAGQPLLVITPLASEKLWITANYKETQLTDVRPGQAVEVKVDAFPDHDFTGRVESIMAGTGSVFSLFPPENATGNYVKVVQRIPVKITLDKGDYPDLRLGMSVEPTILTD
jgi:membrane fusion protein, multidrug efflux system